MEVTEKEYQRWRTDPVTKEVFKILEERRHKIAHSLADGGAVMTGAAEMVGRYKEIKDLLNMEFEDMREV